MGLNIPGLKIGHATIENAHTGVTVFIMPPHTLGSVDVRGPAPGSRESALLAPDKPMKYINGIVFTGGSAYGLGAVDGVMRYLGERGIGHITPIKPIPIVPASVVYDLFFNQGTVWPDADLGYRACENAIENNPVQGDVGAGAGVNVGKWGGFEDVTIMKSGFGLASETIGDVVVSCAAVVNAVGDVVNADGSPLAGAMSKDGRFLVESRPSRRFAERSGITTGANTTLVMVATNAKFDKVQCNRLAQRAHDGMAVAIRPSHTTHDGDTAYAVATGGVESAFETVAITAVDVVAEAIRNAVRFCKTVGPVVGLGG
jgi:L-aminopeptidase/D-esterase-like protein